MATTNTSALRGVHHVHSTFVPNNIPIAEVLAACYNDISQVEIANGASEMAHTIPDFKTKKAFKEAVARGERVTIDPSTFFFKAPPTNGKEVIEGPAAYHKWYAQVEIRDGVVVKVTD